MRGFWSKEGREGGRTGVGRTGGREVTEEAVEEGEEATRVAGIGETGMKVEVDFVVEEVVVATVVEEMGIKGDSDVTMSAPRHTAEPGISSSILQMFQEKTNTFYR